MMYVAIDHIPDFWSHRWAQCSRCRSFDTRPYMEQNWYHMLGIDTYIGI